MSDLHRFHSMGCEIAVGGGSPGERQAIEHLFAERDRIFSRFREESELNRVNAASGSVRVSRVFAQMLSLALGAAEQTGGVFDPTLGSALEAAGYDADFASLRPDPRPPGPPARGAWRSVRLVGFHLSFPAHVQLDLNGVVKGQTVDDALTLLQGDGFVSAGGDLAVRGATVVALPAGGSVSVLQGALATSGIDRRRWSRGGIEQHHLIHPRTGEPAESHWEQVTACGSTCCGADVAAKTAFLLGEQGPEWLDRRTMPGRFVPSAGEIVVNAAWRRSLEPAAACI